MQTKVITISSITAGGKSTLIRTLLELLPETKIISFDDYSIDALPSAPSFDFFLKEPLAAINQYDLTLLMNDFISFYGKVPLILIDFPFGRTHQTLDSLIDQAIYLQTPFDIALARYIKREYHQHSEPQAIFDWCQTYIEFVQPLVALHEKVVLPSCDLILDGTHLPEKNAVKVIAFLEKSLDSHQ